MVTLFLTQHLNTPKYLSFDYFKSTHCMILFFLYIF